METFPLHQTALGYGFALLAVIVLLAFLNALKKALPYTTYSLSKQRKIFSGTSLVLLLWLFYVTITSAKGLFADFGSFPPLLMPMVLLPPLVTILYLTFSGRMDEILRHFSPQFLVGIQSFRIIVEYILWQSFINGFTPVQMTFAGRNHDIFSGILGLLMVFIAFRKGQGNRTLLYIYNVIGLALLINIVTIAILSIPSPIRYFMNEPANTLVAYFPFVILPAVLVPLAYTFHLLSLRQLKIMKHNP